MSRRIYGTTVGTNLNPQKTAEAISDHIAQAVVASGGRVYVGSGEMPEGYNVQIDPEGEILDLASLMTEDEVEEAIDKALDDFKPPASGGENADIYTVVAEGGEQWIGFTYEELGITSIVDLKALQLAGRGLFYNHESDTNAVACFVKTKPEASVAYGKLIDSTLNVAVPHKEGEAPQRASFATDKAEYIEKISQNQYQNNDFSQVRVTAIGLHYLQSASDSGYLILPSRYIDWYGDNGIYMGLPAGYTWQPGATFTVKIWRW